MVVQVMLWLVDARRQHIYCERFSLTLESEVGSEELAVGGIQSRCSRVLMAQIVYRPVPGSTSLSVTSCAVATRGLQQMLVAMVEEGVSPGTKGASLTCQATWSVP